MRALHFLIVFVVIYVVIYNSRVSQSIALAEIKVNKVKNYKI
jgi:uncharacterized membrane protein